MAVIGRVNGPMLKENLLRQGVDLAFETNLLYLDVNNSRIGVKNATPNAELDVSGQAIFNNSLKINGSNLIALGSGANIYLTPNGSGKIITSSDMSLANISLSGNANVSNLNSSNYVNASVLQSNVATGTAPVVVTSTTRVSNLNVAVAGNLVNGNSNVLVAANSDVTINAAGAAAFVFSTNGNLNLPSDMHLNSDQSITGGSYLHNRIDFSAGGGVRISSVDYASSITVNSKVWTFGMDGNLSVPGNLNVTGNAAISNIGIVDSTVSSTNTNANIYLAPNGTGILKVNANTAVTLPVGGSGDRPGSPAAGMLRFSTGTNSLEFHDGSQWVTINSTTTSITTDTFTGDGSTLNFTLSQAASTASVIVTINGTGQKPFTAYTVSGTTLTFTEAPSSSDVIEARTIATSTYVTDIADGTTTVVVSNSSPWARTIVQGTNRLEVNSTNVVLGNVGLVANVTGQSVSNSATTIDQWATSGYTCAKYLVSVTNGTSRQMTELLLTANSTNAYLANIGSVNSGSALMTFTANITSGNATLWGTGTGTGNTVKVSRQLIV